MEPGQRPQAAYITGGWGGGCSVTQRRVQADDNTCPHAARLSPTCQAAFYDPGIYRLLWLSVHYHVHSEILQLVIVFAQRSRACVASLGPLTGAAM